LNPISYAFTEAHEKLYDYIVDCDNVEIASPTYFSQPTGKLLDVCSRFQTYFAPKYFRNQIPAIKPKKGAVILVGGGDGNPEDTYKTVCTLPMLQRFILWLVVLT